MFENILFLCAAYIAAVFATVAGFGSSTLLIPVAVLFMDIKTAIFIVACFHLFNNLFKVKLFFKNIDFHLFLTFGLTSMAFAFLGALCISFLDIHLLQQILGVFLLCFVPLSVWKSQWSIKKNMPTSLIGGSVSGFLAGLIGLGGAVRATFLISFNLQKEVYIATSALIAFVIDLTRIPTYLLTDSVQDKSYYVLLPFLIGTAYLGVKTGKKFLHRIDHELFTKIVLGVLFLIGIKLLFT